MNKKTYIFLIIVLAINTLRYGAYLLEGDTHLYYVIMFLINLIAVFIIFIFGYKAKEPKNEEPMGEQR